MQFLKIVALGLISSAHARTLAVRDAGPVLSAIADVRASVMGIDGVLDDELDAPSNVAAAVADLITKSDALVATIKTNTAKVSAAAALSASEAATVTTAANKLANIMKHIVGDFVEKKDLIAQAGQTKVVVVNLNNQRDAAQGFFAALSTKVPASNTAATTKVGANVVAAINASIAGFGGAPMTTM